MPQDFESAGSGILQKLQLSFLEILKILGTQFSVVHGLEGGVNIPHKLFGNYDHVSASLNSFFAEMKCRNLPVSLISFVNFSW